MGSSKLRENEFAADLTVQIMEIQFDISHVESYRQSLCQTADIILQEEIPSQLRKIEDILQGQKLKSNYQQVARQYSVESIAVFKEKLEEIAEKQRDQQADMEKALEMLFGKPSSKANNKEDEKSISASVSKNNSKISLTGSRKRSSTGVVLESAKSNVSVELKISDSAKNLATKKASREKLEQGEEEEEEEVPVEIPEIATNERVLDLFEELKPLILKLSDTCVNLRNWIVLLIPKAEDGNNFGVEVQEQCLVKLIEVEKQMGQILEEHAAYHLERSTILSKLMSNGEILDYSQYIYDADERQCRKLQDIAHSLRSSYNTVYHTLTNNYEKITAPRGQGNSHIHLY